MLLHYPPVLPLSRFLLSAIRSGYYRISISCYSGCTIHCVPAVLNEPIHSIQVHFPSKRSLYGPIDRC